MTEVGCIYGVEVSELVSLRNLRLVGLVGLIEKRVFSLRRFSNNGFFVILLA